MPETLRPSLAEIQDLLREPVDVDIPAGKRDEMAIPSYLHPNPLIRWLMWRRYQVVADMVRQSGLQSVLEFGCGLGLFLPTLAAYSERVYAVDLFPQYARRLSDRRGLGVIFPDRLADLPAASLDLVVAADVLEHLDDVQAYLKEFHRLLKPGGRLVVSGPTENFVYRMGRIVAGFGGKGEYHVSNINLLLDSIFVCGFQPAGQRSLPFRFPPHLFKVAAFVRP